MPGSFGRYDRICGAGRSRSFGEPFEYPLKEPSGSLMPAPHGEDVSDWRPGLRKGYRAKRDCMAQQNPDDPKAQETAEERRNRIVVRASIVGILAAVLVAIVIAGVAMFQYLTELR